MILTKSIVSTLILDLFLMAGYNEAMKEELDIYNFGGSSRRLQWQ
jgi:hypothetical protein